MVCTKMGSRAEDASAKSAEESTPGFLVLICDYVLCVVVLLLCCLAAVLMCCFVSLRLCVFVCVCLCLFVVVLYCC